MAALDRAIQFFGGQRALAEAVGLQSSMAVSQWRKRGVPPKRARAVELATGGVVTAAELCPEVFGPLPGPEPGQAEALPMRKKAA